MSNHRTLVHLAQVSLLKAETKTSKKPLMKDFITTVLFLVFSHPLIDEHFSPSWLFNYLHHCRCAICNHALNYSYFLNGTIFHLKKVLISGIFFGIHYEINNLDFTITFS